MGKATRSLPPQLAKRAEALVERSAAAAKAEAQEQLQLIRRRSSAIAESFFDIGVALEKLKAPRLLSALGHKTFRSLLETELQMSQTQAYRLMRVVAQIPRHEAVTLGPARSYALLDLAKATPEVDSVVTLLRDRVTLPGRAEPVDVRALSAEELRRAARVERRSHLRKRHRATDATLHAAQGVARRLERALSKLGAGSVSAVAVRRRAGDQAEAVSVRIELPAAAGVKLLRVLSQRG